VQTFYEWARRFSDAENRRGALAVHIPLYLLASTEASGRACAGASQGRSLAHLPIIGLLP